MKAKDLMRLRVGDQIMFRKGRRRGQLATVTHIRPSEHSKSAYLEYEYIGKIGLINSTQVTLVQNIHPASEERPDADQEIG